MIDGKSPVCKEHGLDKEKIMRFLPKGNREEVSNAVMKKISEFETAGIDQNYGEEMLLTHMGVLKECRASMDEYVNAVKFCCLVMGGMSAYKAWEIVFPEKANEVRERNGGELNTSWSAMYNKSKLVTALMAAMYVPVYLVYQPLNAWAIQKQYELARGIGANSGDRVTPVVQQKAAEALYEMTKMPEDNTIQLKIGMDEESKNVQKSLFEQLAVVAANQKKLLESGGDIREVAKLNISKMGDDPVDAEVYDEQD
jgi:hypothetical protein